MKSLLFAAWPQDRCACETAIWNSAIEKALEFCTQRRLQGFTPNGCIAVALGYFPNQPCSWGEAQYRCALALVQTHHGIFGQSHCE
jgi:hypothetical protein